MDRDAGKHNPDVFAVNKPEWIHRRYVRKFGRFSFPAFLLGQIFFFFLKLLGQIKHTPTPLSVCVWILVRDEDPPYILCISAGRNPYFLAAQSRRWFYAFHGVFSRRAFLICKFLFFEFNLVCWFCVYVFIFLFWWFDWLYAWSWFWWLIVYDELNQWIVEKGAWLCWVEAIFDGLMFPLGSAVEEWFLGVKRMDLVASCKVIFVSFGVHFKLSFLVELYFQ